VNLNQVTIHTDKTLEMAAFYQKLGLKIIVDSLPRYARFECPDGDSTLSIEYTDKISTGSGIVLYFECDDVDADVARLKELGISFETDPQDRDWLWRDACLKDPAGNTICLFYAGENRKNPPWRVK
jgi:predicted enzyme related to lactoylglutathione lyase